jgi:hypothetical protein
MPHTSLCSHAAFDPKAAEGEGLDFYLSDERYGSHDERKERSTTYVRELDASCPEQADPSFCGGRFCFRWTLHLTVN